ncbi:hypothetical protein AVEN_49038-1 [Araneus ventricosus]|uniref:Uncharacterized protein n=1 Tax=Araneus ventricosus TaxID=182803 RepID=A0A4Y2C5Z9_ARAVE|nr:hypothetical protein AVEN_249220-1 [Araneus ventricosus]GBL99493.1 hypothetical protein AVEN_49038-1 [Araneus ventricosus]
MGNNLGGDRKHLNKKFSPYNAWAEASSEPLDDAIMESRKREFSYTSSFLLWILEGMAKYSNQEKADMHFMYDLENEMDCRKTVEPAFPEKTYDKPKSVLAIASVPM